MAEKGKLFFPARQIGGKKIKKSWDAKKRSPRRVWRKPVRSTTTFISRVWLGWGGLFSRIRRHQPARLRPLSGWGQTTQAGDLDKTEEPERTKPDQRPDLAAAAAAAGVRTPLSKGPRPAQPSPASPAQPSPAQLSSAQLSSAQAQPAQQLVQFKPSIRRK